MTNFEYFVKDLDVSGNIPVVALQDELTEIGKNGWELVAVLDRANYYKRFIFKKPVDK